VTHMTPPRLRPQERRAAGARQKCRICGMHHDTIVEIVMTRPLLDKVTVLHL
jgi:ribosomal protein S14